MKQKHEIRGEKRTDGETGKAVIAYQCKRCPYLFVMPLDGSRARLIDEGDRLAPHSGYFASPLPGGVEIRGYKADIE